MNRRQQIRKLRAEARAICERQPGYGSHRYRGDPYEAVALQQEADRLERNPAGAACMGTWCPRDKGIRKEHIRKDEFDAENPMHFRLQSRGGAWRYYRRAD